MQIDGKCVGHGRSLLLVWNEFIQLKEIPKEKERMIYPFFMRHSHMP
jgi:hypothetical protein